MPFIYCLQYLMFLFWKYVFINLSGWRLLIRAFWLLHSPSNIYPVSLSVTLLEFRFSYISIRVIFVWLSFLAMLHDPWPNYIYPDWKNFLDWVFFPIAFCYFGCDYFLLFNFVNWLSFLLDSHDMLVFYEVPSYLNFDPLQFSSLLLSSFFSNSLDMKLLVFCAGQELVLQGSHHYL